MLTLLWKLTYQLPPGCTATSIPNGDAESMTPIASSLFSAVAEGAKFRRHSSLALLQIGFPRLFLTGVMNDQGGHTTDGDVAPARVVG